MFCLSPAGDTPSSARLFDAIVSGCIPVVVSDELEVPFEGLLQYKRVKFLNHLCLLKEKDFLYPANNIIIHVLQLWITFINFSPICLNYPWATNQPLVIKEELMRNRRIWASAKQKVVSCFDYWNRTWPLSWSRGEQIRHSTQYFLSFCWDAWLLHGKKILIAYPVSFSL